MLTLAILMGVVPRIGSPGATRLKMQCLCLSHTRGWMSWVERAVQPQLRLGRQYERVRACTCEIPASPARTTHAGTPDFVRTPPFSVSHCKRSDIPPPGVEAHFETRSAPQCQGAVRSSGRTCPRASTSFFARLDSVRSAMGGG